MNNPDYYRLITSKDFLMSRPREVDFLNVQDSTQPYALQHPVASSSEPINPQSTEASNPLRQLTIQVSHGYLSDDIVDDYPTQYNNFTCDDTCLNPSYHNHDHVHAEETDSDTDDKSDNDTD